MEENLDEFSRCDQNVLQEGAKEMSGAGTMEEARESKKKERKRQPERRRDRRQQVCAVVKRSRMWSAL